MIALLQWALFLALAGGFVGMLLDMGDENKRGREAAGKTGTSGYWAWILIVGAVLFVWILAEKGL